MIPAAAPVSYHPDFWVLLGTVETIFLIPLFRADLTFLRNLPKVKLLLRLLFFFARWKNDIKVFDALKGGMWLAGTAYMIVASAIPPALIVLSLRSLAAGTDVKWSPNDYIALVFFATLMLVIGLIADQTGSSDED